MKFPENLKYTKDHEWVKVDGDVATVGITDHAQSELGDVVYVDIPDAEAELSKDDTFGTIEAVKTVADMYAPVSGQIIEVNDKLNDAPETINSDPYGDGWIVKIKMSNPAEADTLMDKAAYEATLN
ncbi:MAG: glycine cleavage system protein GcvH [Bacteroidota bacterium]